MAKAIVRDGTLSIALPKNIRDSFNVHDGDELDIASEDGRLVLTLAAEPPELDELAAIKQAEAELAADKTHRLDDVINGLGRKAR
jgi:bifunctional DNA-binding transcriptional regulator/antitoxin component of YhaV-PrlF toxin-antitoxin module